MWEIIEHTFLDSLRMLPFLMVAYLIVEYISRGAGKRIQVFIVNPGLLGPVGGGLLGLLPQCGISVMAANLYSERMMTMGTLVAIFLATSDEAIPVLFANPGNSGLILQLLGIKMAIALIFGLAIDVIGGRIKSEKKENSKMYLCESGDLDCNHRGCKCSCNSVDSGGKNILKVVLRHSIRIFLFILIILLVLNMGFYFLGDHLVERILMKGSFFQPFLTAIFGMVPSCASSVVLTQLYLENSISFGSMIAGLSGGTGVGLAVLIKNNGNKKETLMVIALLYAIGVAVGLFFNLTF
ncbi:MAG: putative manganese transporter [Anaerovoracaceae bacterium]|jgi:hypothetical protein